MAEALALVTATATNRETSTTMTTIATTEDERDNQPIIVPARVTMVDGTHIHVATQFCYLGCIFTSDLSDKTEILTRLRNASNQIGAMANFFRSTADISTKLQIFMAVPVNTALYGCESWALTEYLRRRITGFFTKDCKK